MPQVEVLQSLVPTSSLAQKASLCKAIRYWVILDAIYRKPWDLKPPFTYSEWYKQILISDPMQTALSWNENSFDIKVIPLQHWVVFLGGMLEAEWIDDFIAVTGFSEAKVKRWLQEVLPYSYLRECHLKISGFQSIAQFNSACADYQRTVAVAKIRGHYHIRCFNRHGTPVISCSDQEITGNVALLKKLDLAFECPEQYQYNPETKQQPFKGHQLIQHILSAVKQRKEHRKFLRNDFSELASRGLIVSQNTLDVHGQPQKKQIFSGLSTIADVKSILNLDRFQISLSSSTPISSQAIQSEQLSAITLLYLNPIQGIQRFFLDLNYIVDGEGGDNVERLKTFLYERVWNIDPIPPLLLLGYASASAQVTQSYVVYPVSINYFRRAAYLRAYGQTPYSSASSLQPYNFRMDRIKTVQVLSDIDEEHQIPKKLLKQYRAKVNLPTPESFQDDMDLAWGFDLSRPINDIFLRFRRQYHDAYIQGSERHITFSQLTLDNINELAQGKLTEAQIKFIQNQIMADEGDIFYHAFFRSIDNNVVMSLRSWGAEVEVLYPPTLRKRIQDDLSKAIAMYQDVPAF